VSFCNYYHGTQFLNTHHVTLGGLLHFWRSLGFVLQLGTFGTTVVPLVPGNKNKYKLHMHQVTQVTCSFCLVTNIHKQMHTYSTIQAQLHKSMYYNVKHTYIETYFLGTFKNAQHAFRAYLHSIDSGIGWGNKLNVVCGTNNIILIYITYYNCTKK
jgi:hypothetical protein